MDIVAEIHAARTCGVVHCGYSTRAAGVGLAAEFGLAPEPASYREIDAATARRVLELILHRDMAYHSEIMPAGRAAELASGAAWEWPGRGRPGAGPE